MSVPEINKCHVCGSDKIVENVDYHSCESSNLFLHWYKTVVSTGLFSRKENCKKELMYAAVRVAVCKDCGTVRFYVDNGDREWIIDK